MTIKLYGSLIPIQEYDESIINIKDKNSYLIPIIFTSIVVLKLCKIDHRKYVKLTNE
jgi:hypothetical protein